MERSGGRNGSRDTGARQELRKIFASAPTLFSVRNPIVAACYIAGATF